jgi:glycosyltransferase involved in cell wall biosynthesis
VELHARRAGDGSAVRIAVNAVGLAPGGGLSFLVNQVRQFEELGDPWRFAYFVSPRCAEALEEAVSRGTVIIPFPSRPGYLGRLVWEQFRFPRLLQRERYDLLYCAGNYAVFGSPIPQVVVDHNPLHFAGSRELGLGTAWLVARLKRFAAWASVTRAESTVYLSDSFAASMASVGFPRPTAVIASGVNVDFPRAPAVEFPLSCDRCRPGGYGLAVHNWYPHKRLRWLASTWAATGELRQRHLVIVGRALGRDGRRQLESVRRAIAGDGCVHLVEDAGRDEVARLYARAGFYVSASALEAFPLTPFEAMSFSVPCVLSDIPPHREVAGAAATYFEVGNAASLVSAVQRAQDERQTLRERGRGRLGDFSWEKHVEALLELFSVAARDHAVARI